MHISEFCIRRPVFATVLSLLLIIFGLVSLERLAVREYPDITRPVVSITTNYRGASANVVENKITQVIEDRIAGIEGVLKIESDSEDERSSIRIEFDADRNIDAAANDVRDRIGRVVAQLPPEADPPQISKSDGSGESVMFMTFNSETMDQLEITDYVERYLLDRLSTVPGVSRASMSGARRAAMRIWIDRQALAARSLTVGDIETALRRENVELPAGRLESRAREFSLRTAVGLETEQDFRDLVIGRGPEGHLVRLGEVADVRIAAENDRTLMRTDGQVGIGIGIEAQSKANVRDVVRGVRAEVERLRPTLPKGSTLVITTDNGLAIGGAERGADRGGVRVHLGAHRHLRIPGNAAGHPDPGGHHPGVGHRRLHGAVRARLLHQRAHAARRRARDRARGRRFDRGAGEHPPPLRDA
jgi:multidrug efflux pump